MADLSNISLTNNVGDISSGNSGNYYQRNQQAQKKKEVPSKLRVGEIVRGAISDRISDELAYVRIPTGTFKAIVSSNLKKGDSLLFKVVEVNPNLILRVHEVATMYNGEIMSMEHLLRILDIPNVPLYSALIDKMRKTRKTILREDVLEIYKLISKAEKELLSNAELDNLLTQLNEMQKAKLPLSLNLIKKLIPLFVSENLISNYLNKLFKNLNNLSDQLKRNLTEYYKDIVQNNYNKNNLFVLSISGNKDQPSFFDILCDIADGEYKNEIIEASSGLRDLIAAMSLWNIISFSGKTPFHYIIPYYYNNEFYVIRIIKQTINKEGKNPISFNFSMPSENLGEIRAKVLGFQKQLKIYLEAESEKIISTLEKFRSDLENAISSKDFKLESLKIGLEDVESELSDISESKSGDHFTIVV